MSCTAYQDFRANTKLNILTFSFLSKEDRDNLILVDKAWRIFKLEFEIQNYQALEARIQKKEAIFLKDGYGIHKEILLDVLGDGGSKIAYQLQGRQSQTLLLPNITINPLYIIRKWRGMVFEEVAMS